MTFTLFFVLYLGEVHVACLIVGIRLNQRFYDGCEYLSLTVTLLIGLRFFVAELQEFYSFIVALSSIQIFRTVFYHFESLIG